MLVQVQGAWECSHVRYHAGIGMGLALGVNKRRATPDAPSLTLASTRLIFAHPSDSVNLATGRFLLDTRVACNAAKTPPPCHQTQR